MTTSNATSTISAASQLLKALGVERVIHIDDYFAEGYQLPDILAAQEGISAERLGQLVPALPSVSDDVDVRRTQFSNYWESLDENDQHDIGQKVMTEVKHSQSDVNDEDASSDQWLKSLFSPIEYVALGKDEWDRDSSRLIGETQNRRTLIIVDQDLSGQDGRGEEGMQIISNLIAETSSDNVLLCMLTGTATIDNQDDKWEEFADRFNASRDRFIVIAKDGQYQESEQFTQRLRFALLTPEFEALRESARTVLKQALDKADERLNKISIVDFDHMVLRVPFAEGVWEPEVLFRLYSTFHRRQTQELAYSDANLEKRARTLRKVSHIGVNTKSKGSLRVRSVEHESRYDEDTVVNKPRSPVQTGDVFRLTRNGNEEEYILLAQPCDLMVRVATGERRTKAAHLVRIDNIGGKNKIAKLGASRFHLPYYRPEGSNEYAVSFWDTMVINLDYLDFCSFNQEGRCELDVSLACPADGVVPAMARRFGFVRDEANRLVERYDLTAIDSEEMKMDIRRRLDETCTSLGGMSPSIEGSVVKFPLKRLKRLRFDYATEALRAFASFSARTAFDVDLGRDAKAIEEHAMAVVTGDERHELAESAEASTS